MGVGGRTRAVQDEEGGITPFETLLWDFADSWLRRDFFLFFNPATGLNFSVFFEVYTTFDLAPFEVPKIFDLGIFKIHKSLHFVIFVLSKE